MEAFKTISTNSSGISNRNRIEEGKNKRSVVWSIAHLTTRSSQLMALVERTMSEKHLAGTIARNEHTKRHCRIK